MKAQTFRAWAPIDGAVIDYTRNPLLAEKWNDAGRMVLELAPATPTIPIHDHLVATKKRVPADRV